MATAEVIQRGRRLPAWAVVGASVLLVATAAVALEGSARARGDELPDTVAGLSSRQDGPSGVAAEALADRLRRDPTVSAVAVRVYGAPDEALVVMALTPTTPFTEQTAGELAARVLGAAGGPGSADDVQSQASEDGRAAITCGAPAAGTSTCLTVEPTTALLVVTRFVDERDGDLIGLTARVRDDVMAAG